MLEVANYLLMTNCYNYFKSSILEFHPKSERYGKILERAAKATRHHRGSILSAQSIIPSENNWALPAL